MSVKEVVLTLNGQNYALRKNTEGEYEAVITAPEESGYTQPEHAYVMELRITDQSGTIVIDKNHDTFGSKMKLAVVERVPPVISPVFPTESAYLTEQTVQIQFDVTDDDSGVKKDTISLQIDAGTMLTKQLTKVSVIEGYHCTYVTALKEGVHILRIKAEDRDGNAIEKIVTFKVDTTAPSLNISEPSDHIVLNVPTCRIVGITNDATSAPCTVTINVNEKEQGHVPVNGDGTFLKEVLLEEGANIIRIKSTDRAGNYAEVVRNVTYNFDAPQVLGVKIEPNPVSAGKIFEITVNATD